MNTYNMIGVLMVGLPLITIFVILVGLMFVELYKRSKSSFLVAIVGVTYCVTAVLLIGNSS